MSWKLTDEEMDKAISEHVAGYPSYKYQLAGLDRDRAIAQAQARKIAEWGEEPCPHHESLIYEGESLKRECSLCWQAFREELEK